MIAFPATYLYLETATHLEAGRGRGGDSRIVGDLKVGPQRRVSLDDARWLATAYGWTLVSDDVMPLGGAVNGVVRIHSSIGDLVIRVHRPWTDPVRLAAVHAVQDRLRTRGIPIPSVIRAAGGETFVTISGNPIGRSGTEHDRLVEVLQTVDADGDTTSRERADIILSTLAPLHRALATIDPTSVPQPAYAAHVDVSEALVWLDDTDAAFAACGNQPGFRRASTVRGAARLLIERIRMDRLALDAELPRQLVHGDFGFGNVLVRGDRVVAIVDFDFMAERPRVFDLAYALYHAITRMRHQDQTGPLRTEEYRWLVGRVTSYDAATHLPLTGAELNALPLEMAMVGLFQAVEAGHVADDPLRAIGQTLSIDWHLSLIAWMVDHAAVVAERMAVACSRAWHTGR